MKIYIVSKERTSAEDSIGSSEFPFSISEQTNERAAATDILVYVQVHRGTLLNQACFLAKRFFQIKGSPKVE